MIYIVMPNIIDIVLPTFFAIFLGYLVGKFTRINMAPVVDITLYIGVPALVLVTLLNKEIILLDAAKMWASSLVIMFGCMLIAWLVFKLIKQKHSGLYVSISMMNTVNIPFPVIYLAYGAEGLVGATLFYIPNVILMYSLGVYIMAGKRWKDNVKEVLSQPVIYAAVIGLLLNFLNVRVPELVVSSLDFVAMMAIPLVLIVLGHNLSGVKLASLPTTLLSCFLRMGVGLAIGLGIVNALNITGVFRSVVILDSAMPAAATSVILATKYRNEAEMVSSVVFLTTLISLASIPFMLYMLG
ncbi:MAG: AEC family transporter [Dehalococcoidales bacterium]|nr:AEC family transporter [Dehalococcoidales bacterium]